MTHPGECRYACMEAGRWPQCLDLLERMRLEEVAPAACWSDLGPNVHLRCSRTALPLPAQLKLAAMAGGSLCSSGTCESIGPRNGDASRCQESGRGE